MVEAQSYSGWSITLQDVVLQNMEMGAVFTKEHRNRVNSVDFHRSADLLVQT